MESCVKERKRSKVSDYLFPRLSGVLTWIFYLIDRQATVAPSPAMFSPEVKVILECLEFGSGTLYTHTLYWSYILWDGWVSLQ